jgi:hypothetical protein
MRWEKQGATEAQLEADRRICLNQAAGTSAGNRRFDHVARGSAFMRCMQERGWRQVPADS